AGVVVAQHHHYAPRTQHQRTGLLEGMPLSCRHQRRSGPGLAAVPGAYDEDLPIVRYVAQRQNHLAIDLEAAAHAVAAAERRSVDTGRPDEGGTGVHGKVYPGFAAAARPRMLLR